MVSFLSPYRRVKGRQEWEQIPEQVRRMRRSQKQSGSGKEAWCHTQGQAESGGNVRARNHFQGGLSCHIHRRFVKRLAAAFWGTWVCGSVPHSCFTHFSDPQAVAPGTRPSQPVTVSCDLIFSVWCLHSKLTAEPTRVLCSACAQ